MIENTEELLGQIVPSGSVVGAMLTEKGDKGDKGDTGETGNDGFSPIITTSKQGKVTTLTIVDAEGTKTATINDGADGSGSGDMLKSTYDANENGIVDNAEKVNNHTVLSDVPANAVFTDTTYTAGTGIDITNGVISNTQTSAEWGNISGDITDQSDLQSALSDKANTSDLAAVATSGSYNDLTNKPTIPTVNNATLTIQKNSTTLDTFTANASVDKTVNISVPTKVSDLSNDSGFITNSVNNLTNYTTTSTLNTLLAGKEKDIPIQNTAPASPEEDDLWIDTSEPEEMQEAIVNEYSESTNKTYSCNYLNRRIFTFGLTGDTTVATDTDWLLLNKVVESIGTGITLENGFIKIGSNVSKVLISGEVSFNSKEDIQRTIVIKLNDDNVAGSINIDNNQPTNVISPRLVSVQQGDLLKVRTYQTKGSAIPINGSNAYTYITIEVVQ